MGGPRRRWGWGGRGSGRERGGSPSRGTPRGAGRGGGGWGEVRGGGPGVGGLRPGCRRGRAGGVAGGRGVGGLGWVGVDRGWGWLWRGGGSPASGLGCRRRSPAVGMSPATEKTLDENGNMR
ncbi:hypothetical protein TIFTF001_051705 [Ficus carica]|uniref:Uncharacterized protein n=1 Tax=Ficus carica TaxID=3494 RepID=A0AA88D776_FICCA|nr:hypothetical protein TIFTF001_051705 [Ficus carica]